MRLITKLVKDNRFFQSWLVAKLFPKKQTVTMNKYGNETKVVLKIRYHLDCGTLFLGLSTYA